MPEILAFGLEKQAKFCSISNLLLAKEVGTGSFTTTFDTGVGVTYVAIPLGRKRFVWSLAFSA